MKKWHRDGTRGSCPRTAGIRERSIPCPYCVSVLMNVKKHAAHLRLRHGYSEEESEMLAEEQAALKKAC